MATLAQIDWLSVAFEPNSGYTTPAADDIVSISGDYEVAASTDGDIVVGIVTNVDDNVPVKSVVVKTAYKTLTTLTASASITAGNLIVAAGSNKFRAYNAGTDSFYHVVGLAVQGASGDDEEFDALVL